MIFTRRALAPLAVAALLVGCGGGGYRPRGFARRFGGDIQLTLVNDLGVTACFVRMGPSTEHSWGNDWLGASETIPSGAGRTFQVQGGPGWDVQVKACDQSILVEARGIPVMGPTQLGLSSLRQ